MLFSFLYLFQTISYIANIGVSLVAASAMELRFPGVVYLPLSDAYHDLAFKTVLHWRQDNHAPLLREFLAVAHEVFTQRRKTLSNFEEWERTEQDERVR